MLILAVPCLLYSSWRLKWASSRDIPSRYDTSSFFGLMVFFILRFSIYKAVRSEYQQSGFLFIRPSGFGLMDQFADMAFWTQNLNDLFYLKQGLTG